MRRTVGSIAAALIALPTLGGCFTLISLEEQSPSVEYVPNGAVLVAVIDNRERVRRGQPETFIGRVHGTFGIPSNWHTDMLVTDEEDESTTLADLLSHRIINGLRKNQWPAEHVRLLASPDAGEARALLEQYPEGSQLLALSLQEWFFSFNSNWVSAFNFDTDCTVDVFKLELGHVLHKRFKERDIIDEKWDDTLVQNSVLRAYRDQLTQIFANEEVRQALATP